MFRNIKDKLIGYNWFLHSVKLVNNITYSNTFWKIAEERQHLGLFDYKKIAEDPIKRFYADYVPENNDKCMSMCLKDYMGVKRNKSINAIIEHGLFFGDFVSHAERVINVPSIITFGRQRVKHLRDRGIVKDIIPIGPYINYAKGLLEEDEFVKLKKDLGRVLLVFPSHSLASEGNVSKYDIDEFAAEIDRIAHNFDTVLISLHYNDIHLGVKYEEKGYRCVTSGQSNDPSFMRRQRTLIDLADMTMSNSIGTHIGYCIYLNKPHYIFKQEVEHSQNKDVQERTKTWRNWDIYREEENEVVSAFNTFTTEITNNQREVVNKYWGTEYVRTPEELKSLLTFSRF